MAFPPSVEKNSTHFVQLVFKNQPWDLEDALHGITFPEPGSCAPALLDPAIHGQQQGEVCD